MAEIGSWNGHQFIVSPTLIRGFTGLTIKGSSETEDKESGGQKYVSRKNSKPSEISLTVELSAFTGCDVQTEALNFVQEANDGAKNYFYLGGKKLIACQLMLTEASVTETEIAPGGKWTRCKVKLTMKQSAKYDGTGGTSSSSSSSSSGGGSSGSSSSSGGSKKTSTKTTSTKTSSVVGVVTGVVTAAVNVAKSIANTVKTGLAAAVSAVNKAKSDSSSTKKSTTSVAKKVSTGVSKVKITMLSE